MEAGEAVAVELIQRTGVIRRMGGRGCRGSTAESQTMTRRDVEERRMGVQRGSIDWNVEGREGGDALGNRKIGKDGKRGRK